MLLYILSQLNGHILYKLFDIYSALLSKPSPVEIK